MNPEAKPAAALWELRDNTKAGVAGFTVNLNCRVALPDTFDAVTVYVVADFTTEGFPDNCPVEVLKDMSVGAAGLIEKLVISPPVEFTVNPAPEDCVTV